MSKVARWSYRNTATVKPRTGEVDKYGQPEYGETYEIACSWGSSAKQYKAGAEQRSSSGTEYVIKNTIYTEDARPQYLDMIQLNGSTEWEEIRERQEFDMSPFNDVPDYFLITG